MPTMNSIVLYVENPHKSAQFYQDLLGTATVQKAPTFCMFALEGGIMLGLWSRHTVAPPAKNTAGAVELGFPLTDKAAVDALYQTWADEGITMVQEPIQMGFGYSFTAIDLDGHRLRVFFPNPN